METSSLLSGNKYLNCRGDGGILSSRQAYSSVDLSMPGWAGDDGSSKFPQLSPNLPQQIRSVRTAIVRTVRRWLFDPPA